MGNLGYLLFVIVLFFRKKRWPPLLARQIETDQMLLRDKLLINLPGTVDFFNVFNSETISKLLAVSFGSSYLNV